jgi:hypothetical protein
VALKAVEFCRNMNFFNIILEGDSLIVVKTLNSRDDSWCCYGLRFNCFSSWQCCHMKRGENKATHTLANEGILKGNDYGWQF